MHGNGVIRPLWGVYQTETETKAIQYLVLEWDYDFDQRPCGPLQGKPLSAVSRNRPARYVLMPGYVVSKNDGDRHYVSAAQLAFLYKVDMRDCYIYNPDNYRTESEFRMAQERMADLIKLAPRYDGDYTLPTE